jgi:autotransporter-associated beta strand protein
VYFQIGVRGTGKVVQTGGTVTQPGGGAMYLGYESGSSGSYEISGGKLEQGSLSLGRKVSTGTFTQTGGEVIAHRDLRIGRGGNGFYTLSDGTLTIDNAGGNDGRLGVGYDTSGTVASFTQSGGLVDTLKVVVSAGSGINGTFNLSGGEIRTASISGNATYGVFNWSGGTIRPRTGGDLTISTVPFTLSGTAATIDSSDPDGTPRTVTFSSPIDGNGILTKTGDGTLSLTGANTYTGDTIIEAGTMSISSAFLADAADVYLTAGTIFDLNFTGTDTIDELFFDGLGQVSGTWGASGSGADHTSGFFTGDGLLLVARGGGDANGDGVVDSADYVLVKQNLGGAPSGAGTGGDLDGDGDVDWADLDALAGAMNSPAGGGTVPEPASALLLLGAAGLLRRRPRLRP